MKRVILTIISLLVISIVCGCSSTQAPLAVGQSIVFLRINLQGPSSGTLTIKDGKGEYVIVTLRNGDKIYPIHLKNSETYKFVRLEVNSKVRPFDKNESIASMRPGMLNYAGTIDIDRTSGNFKVNLYSSDEEYKDSINLLKKYNEFKDKTNFVNISSFSKRNSTLFNFN